MVLLGNPININSANENELIVLPLSNTQISAIISDREINGIFTKIYELERVDGISIRDIHAIREYIILQNISSNDYSDKSYSYKVSRWISSDGGDGGLSESWLDRYFQPMNVNSMTWDDFLSLPSLTGLDAAAIMKQQNRGYINGTFELKNSPGITRWGYKNLLDFIGFGDVDEKRGTSLHLSTMIRTVPVTSSPDEESVSYLPSDHGKPETLHKLRIGFNNNIQAGVLFHRNMGEAANIFTAKKFISLSKYPLGKLRLDKFVIGNYNVSLGQGVTFSTGDQFSPRRSGYGFTKRLAGLETDLTRSDQYVLNGAAMQVSNPFIRLILFSSKDKRDAIVNSDGSFSSLIVMDPRQEYGFSPDSINSLNPLTDSVEEVTFGGHFRYSPVIGWNFGVSYYESLYDRMIDPQIRETIIGGPDPDYSGDEFYLNYMTNTADPEIAAMYSFKGNQIDNSIWAFAKSMRRAMGLDFTTVIGKAVFQGEYSQLLINSDVGFSPSNPTAFVISFFTDLDMINLLALYRNYDLEYDNPYQRSFSNYKRFKTSIFEDTYWLNDPAFGYLYTGNPQPQAEEGLYLASRYQFHRSFILTLNWDTWARKADGTNYYRIVSTLEWRPVFNFRIKVRQKWQARGNFNLRHPSPFDSRETRITSRLNLSNYNRLEFLYSRGFTTFSPRPRLTDSSIGGEMTVGDIGSPDESIGLSLIHNVSKHLSLQAGLLQVSGFLWYFEDTDFRIFSNESPEIHQWGSIRFRPVPDMTIYFKMSQSSTAVSTTIPAAEADNFQWIHNPNVTSGNYDYKIQFDYAF